MSDPATTQTTARTYRIATVHDFAAVPADRRDICLREFRVWIDLIEATMQAMKELPIKPPSEFVWVDDDKHEAVVGIQAGNERIHIASGVMREFLP